MVNRLGDGSTPPSPKAADMTRVFIAQLMLRKPKIEQIECSPDGDIRFQLPLFRTAIAGSSLAGAQLLRTRWCANFVGGFLVRFNLGRFDPIVQRADFPALIGQGRHTAFELWITPTYLQFQFHASLLNQIFNEGLRWELRAVRT